MADTTSITPPPQATDVGDVAPDKKERVLKGVGGFITGIGGNKMSGSPLDRAIEAHHQKRLDEANMHRKTAATYAAGLALSKQGTDPETHQKYDDPAYKGRGQQAIEQEYGNNYQTAWGAYEKAAGVSKDTKAAIQRNKAVVDHLIQTGGKGPQGAAQPGAPGAQGGGPQPPPKAAATNAPPAAAAAPAGGSPAPGTNLSPPPKVSPEGTATSSGGYPITGAGGPNMTPPPQAAATGGAGGNGGGGGSAGAGPTADELSLQAPRLQADMDATKADDRKAMLAKREAEDKAQVEGEAAKKYHINEIKQWKDDFKESFGRDPTQEESDMHLKLTPTPKLVTKIEPDPASPTGYSYITYDSRKTGDDAEVHREQNALPPRGFIPTTSDTTATDAFGNKTTSHTSRSPVLPGAGGKSAAPSSGGGGGGATKTTSTGAGGGGATKPSSSAGGSAAATPQLDENGHIPANAPGVNPQVAEAANQLLDGQDVTKISPAKARLPAAELARKYGWEQGKFTPKEQTQLREATTFLNQAASDPSLAVLDGGYLDRLKLSQALATPDKEGMVGRALTTGAAMNLSEPQAAYVRMYNQLVGTISGLSSLVRSGRATEATIDRLKAELPNPSTTKNSADGRKRIQRLLKEVDVALTKGTFSEASQASTKTGPPPKPSAKSSIDDEIMDAVKASSGKP